MITQQKNTSEYKEISVEKTFEILQTSTNGLSESEAQQRINTIGYNEIREKKHHPLFEFLKRYWGPMPWLLEIAIILSILLNHYLEALIIFLLLTINVIIGFLHARHSQKILEVLKKRLAVKAKVLRDDIWVIKDARELVPGDVFVIELGDLVPADAKILKGDISVDQSSLTGESLPVDLHRSDILYSSTLVTRGRVFCTVLNTGKNTSFGKTAELLQSAKPKSHQEAIILTITKYMLYLGIAAIIAVSLYAWLTNISYVSILTFVVIFLMGAIPVSLPAVITIVQSVGAMELAKKDVLVTRLDSIEDAASIDVLCLDKTGTITQNKLSIAEIVPYARYTKEDVALIARFASLKASKEMIDTAIIDYVDSLHLDITGYHKIQFTPFDPSIKRTEALIEKDRVQFKVMKGSPQVIRSLCSNLDESSQKNIDSIVDDLSKKGYRTLAVARSADNKIDAFLFVGLLALADPLRPDSKHMIQTVRQLGIKPLLLTGDNISIAKEIAQQATIGSNIIRMSDLHGKPDEEKIKICETYDGFAEIYPEDKYKIVRLLQSCGHTVGMTGDGVNDAPALKQAEMGIAVSNSTDVAKGAASVVLEEQGLGVIADAIHISRKAYQRMLTWVINKVTKTIEFVLLLTIGFFWLHDLLITLLGMALLLVANDFATISLATDNVQDTRTPDTWNIKNITLASLILALLLVAQGGVTIYIGQTYFGLEWTELTTFVALTLIFHSLLRVLVVRERRHFWSSRPGKGLTLSIIFTIAAFSLLGIYGLIITPITPPQLLFTLGFSALFIFIIVDFIKYWAFKKFCL
jgi:H+-transporting ATPase